MDERVYSLLKNYLSSLIEEENKRVFGRSEKLAVNSGSKPLKSLDEATRHCIETALAHCRGQVHGPNGATPILKINPSTLRCKIAQLGIRVDQWR